MFGTSFSQWVHPYAWGSYRIFWIVNLVSHSLSLSQCLFRCSCICLCPSQCLCVLFHLASLYPSVSVSHSLFVPLSLPRPPLSHSRHPPVSLSLHPSFRLFVSVSLSLSVLLSLRPSVSSSHPVAVCLRLTLQPICLSVSVSLPLSLSICPSQYLCVPPLPHFVSSSLPLSLCLHVFLAASVCLSVTGSASSSVPNKLTAVSLAVVGYYRPDCPFLLFVNVTRLNLFFVFLDQSPAPFNPKFPTTTTSAFQTTL